MRELENIPHPDKLKRVVIIGGGFAGLELAKSIDLEKYQVVILDKNNYYQFQPLLYQVATAGLEAASISYPLRKMFHKKKNIHIRMCTALSVEPEKQLLRTTIGAIQYDYLVIASGCSTNYFGNNTLKETTFSLKSVPEALLMRNRILLSFEQALDTKDPQEVQKLMTFVIVGGGPTGVELAGALADMRKTILPKDYPELDFDKMEIHLIDASPRLLMGMSQEASNKAAEALKSRGVILHQDIFVKSIDNNKVAMSNDTSLTSQNIFWVAGIKPNSLNGLSQETYDRGRILVDEYNKVKGHDHIYAIGDTCLLISESSPKGHPQVAQVALQMAKLVASNLNNPLKPEKKFVYKDKGSLATIGRNAAVADLGKLHLHGFIAWWIWLLVHIMTIVGARNKVAVFIDWAWNYLNYDVSLRLFVKPQNHRIYDEETVKVI